MEEMRYSMMTAANSMHIQKSEHSFEEFRETIDQCQQNTMNKIKQHKLFIKQKVMNMQG